MKLLKVFIVFVLLIPFFSMDLRAEKKEDESIGKGTLFSVIINDFVNDDNWWTVGLGVRLDFRITHAFSFGLDVVAGGDADGEAITSIFPTISYHLKTKSKKWDVFFGVGINNISTVDSIHSSDNESYFSGFVGVTKRFSKHFGGTIRVFINRYGFGGGSAGLAYIN